jgi:hypothetical protein
MTCTLPDPFHVKRSDALDVARETVLLLYQFGTLCLYSDATGALCVSHDILKDPGDFALVGVYDTRATMTEIAEDIIALERERIHGKAA